MIIIFLQVNFNDYKYFFYIINLAILGCHKNIVLNMLVVEDGFIIVFNSVVFNAF